MSDMTTLVMQALAGDTIPQMSRAIGAEEAATRTAITRLLDSDGDGSAVDDVAKIGSTLLGGFFK